MGKNGHTAMANLANLFIDRQICELDRIESEGTAVQKAGEWSFTREENIDVIPRVRLLFQFYRFLSLLLRRVSTALLRMPDRLLAMLS
jgi:hypothetical protein